MQQTSDTKGTRDRREAEQRGEKGGSGARPRGSAPEPAVEHAPLEMAPVDGIDWSQYVTSRLDAFGQSW